jgi:hypothetical protein
MRLTQLVEAAAKFVELLPPQKFKGGFEKLIPTLRGALDDATGVGWILDPTLAWKSTFQKLMIEKRILREIHMFIASAGEGAAESDQYDDQVYYHELQQIFDKHGKVTYEPIKSPTTGRSGWKFVLKPSWNEAKKQADQAVAKYMKEQAQKSRR